MSSTTYTRESKLDEIVNYLAQIDFKKSPIRIDIDGVLKPFFDSDRDDFPILCKVALSRLLKEHNVIETLESYQIILDTKNIKKIQNISVNDPYPQTFDGIILGIGPRMQYIRQAWLECLNGCHQLIDVPGDREVPEISCVEHDLLMSLVKEKSIYDFTQRLVIQEPLSEARNSNPIDYDCRIVGTMVGNSFTGQKKRVMVMPRRIYSEKREIKNQAKILFDVLSIADLDEEKRILPSNKEVEDYRKQSELEGWFDKIIESFAPDVIGEDLRPIKKALLLSLVGSYKTDEDERADINLLLLGDPSVAKSSLLKYCQGICHKVIYTSGRGASAAGLTIGMVKRPDGSSIAQAGVLPLCHNGIALIDELDKMDAKDRSGLHEAMEQQTCSIAKAGTSLTLPAQTTVIAAANPKFGRWDPNNTILENTDLTLPLLSRFDIKFRMLDTVNYITDKRKANHILSKYREEKSILFSRLQMLALVNHARSLRPRFSEQASEELERYYVDLRAKNTKEIRIDVRQLKALVRLCIAHAKLHFKDFVDLKDVKDVIQIYEASLESFGIDLNSKTEQSTFMDTKEKAEHDAFNECWVKSMDESQHVTKPDMISKLSQTRFFNEDQAKHYFEKKIKQKLIIENHDGTFRRTQ